MIFHANERHGIVDTFPLIADVNFAFRVVSRIPYLLSTTSNISPAKSADCDILPGELAKVHVYYTRYMYVHCRL